MATITIRNLDDGLKAALRVRAAEHGRSMEAEVRAILHASLAAAGPGPDMASRIRERFADLDEADLDDAALALPAHDELPRAAPLSE